MKNCWVIVLALVASAAFGQNPDSDLRALIQRYADVYTRGDATALGMLYSEDALLLPPNRAMLKGRSEITTFWKQSMGGKLTLTPVLVRGNGDSGYVVGRFAFGAEPPSGKFTVCAVRDGKGKWLISADIWNDDQPPKGSD